MMLCALKFLNTSFIKEALKKQPTITFPAYTRVINFNWT